MSINEFGVRFKNAPIIIPTLNRYEHLKRCVTSLANNKLAKDSELVISLDYPPHEKYREGWEKIKEYLPTIVGFGKVTVLCADENIGAAKNCNKLRSYVKGLGYDAFILSEDDNVFAPNFLDYMNWALRTYKDDDSILAVCGYKRVDVSFLKNNVYKYPRFNAWGYGMWFKKREKLDKWENFELLQNYVDSRPLYTVFTKQIFLVNSVMRMLYRHVILGDSLPYLLPLEERYCLYPKISLVRNEGFDGSGLHNVYTSELYNMYHLSKVDENVAFKPHIVCPLYDPALKRVYNKAYKRSFKLYIDVAIKFLMYKLFGKYYRFG